MPFDKGTGPLVTGFALVVGVVAFLALLVTGASLGAALAPHLQMLAGVVPLALAALAALAAPKGRYWPLVIGAASVFALFAVTLATKWSVGLTSDVLMFGLLPVSDASRYLAGAVGLLTDGAFDAWNTRRPLTAIYLASLLDLAGGDLRQAVAILVLGLAAATALVGAALWCSHGVAAAMAGVAILGAFISPTVGTVMSENVGFLFGGLGFALMWRGVEADRPFLVLAGLSLLGLGLAARAGAMFALPALALWVGWWRRGDRRFSPGWCGAALLFALAPLGLPALANAVFGPSEGLAFSNFSYTLYGLASGGHPWTRFLEDFPHLATLDDAQRSREAYALALERIAARPWDLIVGLATRYNDFFFNTGWHKFFDPEPLRGVVIVLTLTGLVHAVRVRNEPLPSLVLWATAGVWLSVPFIGDGGYRIHAATVPFTAALAALGAARAMAWFRRIDRPAEPPAGLGGAAICLAALALLLPASAGRLAGSAPEAAPAAPAVGSCPAGTRALALRSAPGARVNLSDRPRAAGTGAYAPRLADARRSQTWGVAEARAILRSGTAVHVGIAFEPGTTWRARWLVGSEPFTTGWRFAVCGMQDDGLVRVLGAPAVR